MISSECFPASQYTQTLLTKCFRHQSECRLCLHFIVAKMFLDPPNVYRLHLPGVFSSELLEQESK